MINLEAQNLIGKGSQRVCYSHPNDEGACIKIPHDSEKAREMQILEAKYFQKIAEKTAPHISTCYGAVETNLGDGECFELVRDADGTVSKPLTDFILQEQPPEEEIIAALAKLCAHLLKHRIQVHDLSGSNILSRQLGNGEFQLVIVDGVGDPSAFAAIKNISFLYSFALARRWKRLLRRLNKHAKLQLSYKGLVK